MNDKNEIIDSINEGHSLKEVVYELNVFKSLPDPMDWAEKCLLSKHNMATHHFLCCLSHDNKNLHVPVSFSVNMFGI